MGDHSSHHRHHRSPSTDIYGILGISKGSSIKDMCRVYKSLVHKWYPDSHRSPSSKIEDEGNFKEMDEFYKALNDKKQEKKSGTRENLNHVSIDDSFVSRSTSFLAKCTSRRSTTPSPRPTYLSNCSSRKSSPLRTLNFSLSRTFSRKSRSVAQTSPKASSISRKNSPSSSRKGRTEAETSPNASSIKGNSYSSLSRSTSRNSPSPLTRSSSRSCTTETERQNISRSTSRRSTTPIIYSQSTARRKPPPIEKMLECTLEELCHGGLKKIKIIRDVISDEGIIVQEEETLTINLKPGWRRGTKVTFEGKGDEKPGYLPADIIFLIEEKRHPLFRRQEDNLEIAVEIPLVKALTGCSLSVPLLGGETMSIHFTDIIYPGYEKVIQGQGMPNPTEGKRGDLRITFLVNFPTDLTEEQRSEACSILNDCS